MKKALKWMFIVLGCVIGVIGFFVIAFIVGMTPDKDEEAKVTAKAEEYLKAEYSDQMEIYDTLYDNMGNFGFEYAAKAANYYNHVSFLVYEDSETGKMVDDYAVSYFEEELQEAIVDDVEKRFRNAGMIVADYKQTAAARKYLGETDLPEIKDLDVAPTLSIWMDRGKEDGDKQKMKEIIDILKKDIHLPQVKVMIHYYAASGDGTISMAYGTKEE
ncbi:hypothetical protein MUN89_02735 [Halobacillus salinarum]|uniref:Uncharacterized protein n=1 Tax=Halobacillus salinarum TaxID=2932257 RepID=A0ABY4EK92_9BACI|nr:hypothetical protein [Halobacillus salinarum]UOQ44888.1 hypothetical protein MUN89_02735 [Halobacillus salinarum]